MAIYICNEYPSMKERNRSMKEYRAALEGSVAYNNNEVTITEYGTHAFILAIGIENGKEVHEYIVNKGM